MTEKPKPGAYKDLECTQPAKEGDRVAVWVDKLGNKAFQPNEENRPSVPDSSGHFGLPNMVGGGYLGQPAMVVTVFDKDGIACNVTGLPTKAQQYLDSVVARAEKAEAAIWHALERLDASLFTNAEHQQAKDILRDALKPRPE